MVQTLSVTASLTMIGQSDDPWSGILPRCGSPSVLAKGGIPRFLRWSAEPAQCADILSGRALEDSPNPLVTVDLQTGPLHALSEAYAPNSDHQSQRTYASPIVSSVCGTTRECAVHTEKGRQHRRKQTRPESWRGHGGSPKAAGDDVNPFAAPTV